MKVIAAAVVAVVGAVRVQNHGLGELTLREHEEEFELAQEELEEEEESYEWDGDSSPFEAWASELDTPDCPARVVRSTCNDTDFRGIVVFYHGYSACSEQADSVSGMLADTCFDVLAPTMPGHGTKFVWCGEGGSSDCDVILGNGNGWTHNSLPTDRYTYDRFSRSANRATKRELRYRAKATGKQTSDLELNLIGLSFGAPMAIDIAMRGGYSRQLLVNPYLALGDETIDQANHECEELIATGNKTSQDCEKETVNALLGQVNLDTNSTFGRLFFGDETEEVTRKVFTTMAKLSDAVGDAFQGQVENADGAIASVMQRTHEWGGVCNQIFIEGRGGFCKFRTKHYLATHSFGLHTLLDAQQWGAWGIFGRSLPQTQIMTTERDGRTRNGLTYDLARHLTRVSRDKVSMCMHKFQHGTDRSESAQYWDDANSMPHANLKGTRAGDRWWEEKLFDNVKAFITGEQDNLNEPEQIPHDRNVCEAIDLSRGRPSSDTLELVHHGIAPTWRSELWPGLVFDILGLTH